MPQEGFYFNEKAHLYVLDGKPMTGVTTILGVIAKPALIQWAADETAKYLGWYNEKYTKVPDLELVNKVLNVDSIEEWQKVLCEARLAHSKKKTDAGSIGTDVHAEIEKLVKASMQNATGRIPQGKVDMIEDPKVKSIVEKFVAWVEENQVTFLESEKRLYSKKYWYAGTTDLLYMKDGKKYIGDIKTSSAIYPEMFMQMAGYQIALEENGEEDIFGSTIIRCGKDGSFEVQDGFDDGKSKRGFLAALELYRVLNS